MVRPAEPKDKANANLLLLCLAQAADSFIEGRLASIWGRPDCQLDVRGTGETRSSETLVEMLRCIRAREEPVQAGVSLNVSVKSSGQDPKVAHDSGQERVIDRLCPLRILGMVSAHLVSVR